MYAGALSIKPLSCFVGLGNRSARDKQPVIACPEVHVHKMPQKTNLDIYYYRKKDMSV